MTIDWGYEAQQGIFIEVVNLLLNHSGYAAIAAAAALFKLAIAATLAAYTAFLCATLVGGLVMYLPTLFLAKVAHHFEMKTRHVDIIWLVMHFGLSPMVGAFVLNVALGWSLALAPMLAIGGATIVIALALAYTVEHCCSSQNTEQSDSNYSNTPAKSTNTVNPNQPSIPLRTGYVHAADDTIDRRYSEEEDDHLFSPNIRSSNTSQTIFYRQQRQEPSSVRILETMNDSEHTFYLKYRSGSSDSD